MLIRYAAGLLNVLKQFFATVPQGAFINNDVTLLGGNGTRHKCDILTLLIYNTILLLSSFYVTKMGHNLKHLNELLTMHIIIEYLMLQR